MERRSGADVIDVLVLRLDAPLMSFGGVVVDNRGVCQAFPARSMLAGLLGNALGLDHRDAPPLSRLQERLVYAVRRDRRGVPLVDFQTVDLGQPYMEAGWTTHGRVDARAGASSGETHIRYRHYIADAIFTVALTLVPADEAPTVASLAEAVRAPERPLFLGRKACLPASPLVVSVLQSASIVDALKEIAPVAKRADDGELAAWWPDDLVADDALVRSSRRVAVTDERDWSNQVHVGRRFVREGTIALAPAREGGP